MTKIILTIENHTTKMQLKTFVLSSKIAISMMTIPALPYKFDEKGKDK